MMELKLNWMDNFSQMQEESKRTGKPMLLFFHSEHCTACKALLEKTLKHRGVIQLAGQRFIAGKFELGEPEAQKLARKYGVLLTPTVIITDSDGREIYRIVGYLPPDDYMAELTFGDGRVAFNEGDYRRAQQIFDRVFQEYPDSGLAPEAIYDAGIANYEATGDVIGLRDTYEHLRQKYPDSDWTRKAEDWKDL